MSEKGKKIRVADLFCGAGGASTGLLQAADERGVSVELVAVNHWNIAVETHAKNHPGAQHHCVSLDSLDPRKAVPGGKLDLLWASPECTHHSRARGGKPMSDQSRATAWCVLRWADALEVETIIIENVSEFVQWGPTYPADHPDEKLRSRPVPSERGKFFRNFVRNLRCLGYAVEWQELVCANYGDATTRKRFFLMARKGRRKIKFPIPTHQPPITSGMELETGLQTWVPAREIIDWNLLGTSIFGRKRPLKENTLRRILVGLEKFGGARFVLGQQSGAAPRSVNDPLPTIASAGAISLTQPFLIVLHANQTAHSIERPVGAICAGANHYGLIQPFLMGAGGATGQQSPQDVDAPMGTILADDRRALCQPYLIEYHGGRDGHRRNRDLSGPMPTMDTSNRFGLCQPYILAMEHSTQASGDSRRCYSLDRPLVTITSKGLLGLCEPFLVSYYGNGQALSVGDPVDTIPTKDRFGLAQPMLADGAELRLDILFRMLAPHELAAAHSFPRDYQFAGNRDDIVRQIGNSNPVKTARALGQAALCWQ